MNLRVTEVKIRLHDGDNNLVGWASCVVNGCVFLNNIAIVQSHDGGLVLHYPKTPGRDFHHFNPITREAQRVFDDAILGVFLKKETRRENAAEST